MLKGDIEMLLKKHTNGVNSFVDSDGKNHWYDLIDDIYNLAQKELNEAREAYTDPSRLGESKKTHTHFKNGNAIEYPGTARDCKESDCLVKTHQHFEENSDKMTNRDGSVLDCTDYCKKKNTYTLDVHEREWVGNGDSEKELPEGKNTPNPWMRDCIFTRDMMRTIHTRLTGKVLTLVDASVVETRQNKALKDLIHNAIWGETWNPLVQWMYEQEHKKGTMFPFYHEPQGLDQ